MAMVDERGWLCFERGIGWGPRDDMDVDWAVVGKGTSG